MDRAVAELTELGYADRFTSLTMCAHRPSRPRTNAVGPTRVGVGRHVGEDEGREALVEHAVYAPPRQPTTTRRCPPVVYAGGVCGQGVGVVDRCLQSYAWLVQGPDTKMHLLNTRCLAAIRWQEAGG